MQAPTKTFLFVTALTISCVFSFPAQVDSNKRSFQKNDGSLESNHSQVIIIGAGASGITAAARLLEHGIDDVTILESEDRIGGRVHSVPFGSGVVDLGSMWIHGAKGNVIYDMAEPLGLLDVNSPSVFDNAFYLGSNGSKVDAKVMNDFFKLSSTILFNHDALSKYNGSLGHFFHDQFTTTFTVPRSDRTADPSIIPLYLSWIEKMFAYESGTDSWFNISAKGLPQFWDIPGPQTITFKDNGLSSIIDLITKRCPNPEKELPVRNKTRLGTKVKTINWGSKAVVSPTGKRAVLIETSDGAKYTADFVIVTVSLGVLKKTAATTFNPPITGRKLNAIQHLGFGEVEQLFFEFNETWWPTNVTGGISVLSTYEDNQRFKAMYPKLSEKGEWTDVLTGLYVLPARPSSVLFTFVSGESVRNMDNYSDEEIAAGVLKWFHMYSNLTIPSPVSFVRSKWCRNPNFLGSFSYRSLNSEKYDAWPSSLAEPLIGADRNPEVLFCGEATSKHHYSTVHGAIETGRREADRILDFLRKSKKLLKTSNKI